MLFGVTIVEVAKRREVVRGFKQLVLWRCTMRRSGVVAIAVLVGLMVYSAVMAQGGVNTYMPLTMKADQPTATLVPTATQTPIPTPESSDIVNGDFEQGATGWQWSGNFEKSPILAIENGLGEYASNGAWAVRLSDDTSRRVWQDIVVPSDRPVLIYYRKVRDAYSGCFDDNRAGVEIIPHDSTVGISDTIALCDTWSPYGWQRRHLDLTPYINKIVRLTISAGTYSTGSEYFWVDNLHFEETIPSFDPPTQDGSPNALELSIYGTDRPEQLEISTLNQNLLGWYAQDTEGNRYTFPDTVGGLVTLYTRTGTNTDNELYWGLNFRVWQDDCAVLFTAESLVVGSRCN